MSPTPSEPIAVIGSACRFPGGASSASKLWDLLRHPRDVLSKIPQDRFNADAFYHQDSSHHGSTNVLDSYFLTEDISRFDAQFFGIKPVEARAIDPQHRVLLETVYESLESAGIPMEKLAGSDTGVFVGQMCEDWSLHVRRDMDQMPVYTASGTARSITSNRVSFFFDWHGPSITIDTACSSSLVAVHQAVQSLRSGESSVAVAAGSNLIIIPEMYIAETKLKMLSPTGRSRMWDIDADGYARGEGVAALILKPLSAALRDGDQIDYLIRETAVNADGRTAQGLTMPSNAAQAELIRSAYRRAGLDITCEKDRPQYFEAHGTGTQAGDPQEAQAIHDAFFGTSANSHHRDLYVGSIKTITGHTEGTAGVAGMMKAGLALQNSVILPNMHFNNLNPKVAPFYDHLAITTKPVTWPDIGPDGVRRASVNSFGFGGSNAHAILEAYTPKNAPAKKEEVAEKKRLFTFSASSRDSLLQTLEGYPSYLEAMEAADLPSLSYTLQERRSELLYRTTFAASSPPELAEKMVIASEAAKTSTEITLGVRSSNKPARILGVFTGQGAQWVAMGRELIREYPLVWKTLNSLDVSLSCLPVEDRPSWTIIDELLSTDAESSHMHEADRSQPLCTAIQIALVDLLAEVGVSFEAVVGHSSGEIAAAYAAGFHDAKDAIRIAYYRGLCVKRAKATQVTPGAMMAVGTTFEDGTELCELPDFEGRICVAASNAPASITISGDSDAIDEAKIVMDDEKKFARKLKVDTAYHSHHMQACTAPYMERLMACKIKVLPGSDTCTWYSSVREGDRMEADQALSGEYWKENMVCPVLFSQAVSSAIIEHDQLNGVVELGPHPALQGPATQTIQEVMAGSTLPYIGALSREKNDAESFLAAVGFLWSNFGKSSFNLAALHELADPLGDKPRLMKDAPSYSWDHSKRYWWETRMSRAYNSRTEPVHELLGVKQVDSAGEIRWKNNLQVRELPWVSGHQLEGQVLFPAAAYVVSVLEAAQSLAEDRPIKLITIEDLVIGRAIMLDEEDERGVEVQLTFAKPLQHQREDSAVAEFRYSSAINPDADLMTLNASGRVVVTFGEPDPDTLPQRSKRPPNLVDVGQDLFYTSLADLGYQYGGSFRCLSSLERVMGHALTRVNFDPTQTLGPQFSIHPAPLDAAIQSLLLAACWPGDGKLRTLHVPTGIKRLRFNPYYSLCDASRACSLPCEAAILGDASSSKFGGDIQIFPEDGLFAAIQLEELEVQPIAPFTEQNDRQAFVSWDWNIAAPDGPRATDFAPSEEDTLASQVTEKAAVYYLQHLRNTITQEELDQSEWHFKRVFDFADYVLDGVANGTRPYSHKSWLNTTREEIYADMEQLGDSLEVRLTRTVGENLTDAVRGKTQILEHMMEDDLLYDYYVDGRGIYESTSFIANMVEQIVHRYGDLNILEIGAGTGASTKRILRKIGHAYQSYTFTDISTGFFEKANEAFAAHTKKMNFKALDIEKDIEEQGYVPHSYDLVVATAVLHATKSLSASLANVRRLLKPGGFLALVELTDITESIRIFFTMSGLPGFWVGYDDGRVLSPAASPERWDSELKQAGFSGVDTISSLEHKFERPSYALISRAVDDRISFLDRPLSTPAPWLPADVIILGGIKPETRCLIDETVSLLSSCHIKTRTITTLEELKNTTLSDRSTMLSYMDLDEAVFKNFSSDKLEGLKHLIAYTRTLLWVTRGRQSDDPYSNMSVGFGRTLNREVPTLATRFFDVDSSELPSAKLFVEHLLQLDGARKFHSDVSQSPILYSEEGEVLYRDSQILIPRLRPMAAANQRLNSSKRMIKAEQQSKDSLVEVSPTASGYIAKQATPLAFSQRDPARTFDVKVSYSSITAVQTAPNAYRFVVCGKEIHSGQRVIALAAKNASRVSVEPILTVPVNVKAEDESGLVQAVFLELLGSYITSEMFAHDCMHIHGAIAAVVKIVHRLSRENGVKVTFSTSREGRESPLVKFIHPQWSKKAVMSRTPQDITCFINMDEDLGVSSLLEAQPAHCSTILTSDLVKARPARPGRATAQLGNLLKSSAARYVQQSLGPSAGLFSLEDLNAPSSGVGPFAVVDWVSPAGRPFVEPIDAAKLFSADKTYALFGLTSDLAQSLCIWMIEHGAKYVVLTSRNPRIDDSWLAEVKARGGVVKIYASDITNEDEFKALYQEITETLPPVAGVVNGAMVLQDTMIEEMTLEIWDKAVRPKVCGSVFLDKYFDKDMEFFILFSSIVATHGNEGQSNYGAGNMFSTGLVFNRRKRGLRASVLHIGPIAGAGYIVREALDIVENRVLGRGHTLLSQTDFFTGFAEAVLAGRVDPHGSPEVTLSERKFTGSDGLDEDRRYQYSLPRGYDDDSSATSKAAAASMRVELARCVNMNEVFEVVKDAFCVKLASLLQATITDQWKDESLESAANDLGVDSLIAVDIRTWFLRELEVDCPVLKILGGATIRELVDHSISKLSPEMLPSLDGEAPAQSKAEEVKPVLAQAVSSQTASVEMVAAMPVLPLQPSLLKAPAKSTQGESTRAPSPTEHTEPSGVQTPASSHSDSSSRASKMTEPKRPMVAHNPSTEFVRKTELSPGQLRFYTLISLLGDSLPLNIASFVKLEGPLRVNDLVDAIHIVGQRHEALRTCFVVDDSGLPAQGILASSGISVEHETVENEASAEAEFNRLKNHPFDLASGESMRIAILRQSSRLHFVIIAYNHLVMDGTSFEVFLADLAQVYAGQTLPSAVLQYPDFVKRQLTDLRNGSFNGQLEYWRHELSKPILPLPLLPFASARNRHELATYDFNSADHTNSTALTTRIKLACQKVKANSFHFYFTAFEVLLSRLLEIDEVCIGMADAGRHDNDTVNGLGNYVNPLPIILRSGRAHTFADALQEVRQKTLGALANSQVPFDVLLDRLQITRSASYSPIFQAFINYRSGVQEKRAFGDADAEVKSFTVIKTGYDISLDIVENPGGQASMSIMVQKALYSKTDAAMLMKIFVQLLEGLAKNPTGSVMTPPLFNKQDLHSAIELGRGKMTSVPDHPTLVHRVDYEAQKHPEKMALKDSNGTHLTYAEMSKRVDSIAAILASKPLPAGSNVGVYQSPTIDLVCSMLAIMRLGHTYLPLDPRLPPARLQAMIDDCSPAAIIIDQSTNIDASRLSLKQAHVFSIEGVPPSAAPCPNSASSGMFAALIYTSGSTGTPKGILLKHEGLLNEIEDSAELFQLGPQDNVLQQSAIGFDLSMWQMFNALANGSTSVIVCKEHRVDPMIISSLLRQESITFTLATPSEYTSWIHYGSAADILQSPLRLAVACGEMVTKAHSDEILGLNKPGLRLYNGYGPTETSIVISKTELNHSKDEQDQSARNPVGYSTRNGSVYIVDSDLQLLPAGFTGEILIGGPGVASGYYKQDAMTQEKFLRDPYASPEHISRGWTRMYRTGDRGFLDAHGRLTVESRIMGDTEVKLRGIRMDVQDVEKAIIQAGRGAIREAIVSVRGEPRFLVVHLVFSNDIPEEEQKRFYTTLIGRLPLPQYMCPAIGVPIRSLPLNSNGKVDRGAIAELPVRNDKTTMDHTGKHAQLSKVELQLRDLWLHSLPPGSCNAHDIMVESDFFNLGGNSGLIVQLQRAIRDTFSVAIPFVQLFEASTLQEMAAKIESHAVQANINWEKETAIHTESIKAQALQLSKQSRVTHGPGRVVLLTGATGNLATALLPALASKSSVSKIHCVAVRDLAKARAVLEALSLPANQLSKVQLHAGDMTEPRLGLAEGELADLAAETDSIVHLAATRSFWDSYQTLHSVNVASVHELILLAAGRKIPIHFMSSGGVARYGSTTQPPADGSDGYVSSKWAVEQILSRVTRELEVPTIIYRTLPVRHDASEVDRVKVLDAFAEYARKISTLPSDEAWDGHMDLMSLHAFAQDLSLNVQETGTTGLVSRDAEVRVGTKDISSHVNASLTQKELSIFERVSALEWIGKVKKAGFPYLLASQSAAFKQNEFGTALSLER